MPNSSDESDYTPTPEMTAQQSLQNHMNRLTLQQTTATNDDVNALRGQTASQAEAGRTPRILEGCPDCSEEVLSNQGPSRSRVGGPYSSSTPASTSNTHMRRNAATCDSRVAEILRRNAEQRQLALREAERNRSRSRSPPQGRGSSASTSRSRGSSASTSRSTPYPYRLTGYSAPPRLAELLQRLADANRTVYNSTNDSEDEENALLHRHAAINNLDNYMQQHTFNTLLPIHRDILSLIRFHNTLEAIKNSVNAGVERAALEREQDLINDLLDVCDNNWRRSMGKVFQPPVFQDNEENSDQ